MDKHARRMLRAAARRLATRATVRAHESSLPLVAIIGAPNVGKSTLFNRLTAPERRRAAFRPLALVSPEAGTTRDRLESVCEWMDARFRVQDTGGVHGLDDALAADARLTASVEASVLAAVRDAAAVLLLVDAREGITNVDQRLASALRPLARDGLAVLVAANKADSDRRVQDAVEFWELKLGQPHPISAVQVRR